MPNQRLQTVKTVIDPLAHCFRFSLEPIHRLRFWMMLAGNFRWLWNITICHGDVVEITFQTHDILRFHVQFRCKPAIHSMYDSVRYSFILTTIPPCIEASLLPWPPFQAISCRMMMILIASSSFARWSGSVTCHWCKVDTMGR